MTSQGGRDEPGAPVRPGTEPEEICVAVLHEPEADELRIVDDGLDAANRAAAPIGDVRPLCCMAKTRSGAVVGGATGRTWGRCAELRQLWVDEAHRRQGTGTRLIREFEAQAMARGCDTIYLETFSFQAPDLYRSLGYATQLQIQGFAPGISKLIMVRFLGHTKRVAPAMTGPQAESGKKRQRA